MSIAISLSAAHRVIAAASHWYHQPTEPLYLDRVLECHDFIYLAKGQWMITENSTDYLLEEGDVLLLASGHHHYTRLPCAPDTRTMCLHISGEKEDVPGAPHILMLPSLIHARGSAAVKQRFEEIIDGTWRQDRHREERLSALFRLLLFDLADIAEAENNPHAILADQVIRVLRESPHRKVRLTELEQMLNTSDRAINRAVREKTGMTFTQYQTTLKLDMAAQQMRLEPEVGLREIALQFGFYDEFHLSKSFKAHFGISPSDYRKESVRK